MSKWPITLYVRFASVFAAVGAAALAISVSVPLADASHSWGNYHWARTSNPFTLKVGDNVSSAWDPYLDEAISDWSASSVLDLTKVAGATTPKTCRATRGRIEACSSKYGFNGWLGLAQIWVSGNHISQATTKVNDSYFNTSTYNTPAWRRLVMCQEIAHDFGLDHQDVNFNNPNLGSCMDYTGDPDGPPSNEHPNAHDFEQLETMYAHFDSTTTVGSTISPALAAVPFAELRAAAVMAGNHDGDGDLNDPSQWGRLVSESRDGRLAVYERDLGAGQRLLTRVIWAEPRGRR